MDTCSVKSSLSTVVICEKLTVDVLFRPDTVFSSNKLPGREAISVLDVITAHITVSVYTATSLLVPINGMMRLLCHHQGWNHDFCNSH